MPTIVLKEGSRPPWVGLAAALWIQIAAGNSYTFPLYSPALKSILGFSQKQLTIIAVAVDFGESFGLLPGFASNKFPPWALLAVGVAFCFLGYGVVYLAVGQFVSAVPYWLLWVALVVGSNSNAWFGTAVLVTNMRNFPLSRGTVSGILKGYIGFAASVYTLLFNVALGESATKLLMFLSIGLPFICLCLMYFIRPCTPASGEDTWEHGHFMFTQGASVLVALYLLVSVVLHDTCPLPQTVSFAMLVGLVVLMLSPLVIPLKMTMFPASKTTVPDEGLDALLPSSSSSSNLEEAEDSETLLAVGEGAIKRKRKPRRGEDFTICEAIVKADFWLLWVVCFAGTAAGLTFLNNLSQIGTSFGASNTTLLLALFGFCNFAGRLGSGVVSEYFVRSRMLPRTVWITMAETALCVSFVLFAVDLKGILYIATSLVGLSFGVLYSALVPTTSELFGLKHFGIIYSVMGIGNPVGALIFSGFLAGNVYDDEAAKQMSSVCLGACCFRLTFIVLAALSAFGTLLGVVLTVRVRPVYQMLYSGGSFRMPTH